MKRKLKIFSIIVILTLVGSFSRAQKIGNGGNFDTLKARNILAKIANFMELSIFSEAAGPDLEVTKSLFEIYHLNSADYLSLGNNIYVLKSSRNSQELCFVASTEVFSKLSIEDAVENYLSFFSTNLIRFENLPPDKKADVAGDIQRGQNNNLVGKQCVFQ